MAARTKKATALDLCMSELRKNKKVAYADVKAKADKKRIKLFPITYGRAKALLGLVPVAKRGKGKAAKKKAAARKGRGRPPKQAKNGRRRGPGRPRKSGVTGLVDLIDEVKAIQQERDLLRRTLEKVREALAAI